jgi:hypothetical protein
LFSKHPILLAKILNDLQLALVHPPGDGDQQQPEWVEHSLRIQNPLSLPPSRSSEISHLPADPVFGPYGIAEFRRALADESQEIVRAVTRRGFLFQAEVRLVEPLSNEAQGPIPALRGVCPFGARCSSLS